MYDKQHIYFISYSYLLLDGVGVWKEVDTLNRIYLYDYMYICSADTNVHTNRYAHVSSFFFLLTVTIKLSCNNFYIFQTIQNIKKSLAI